MLSDTSVDSFTVVHRGPKDFPLGAPYVLAIVELEEGPRLMTNLVGAAADPAAVQIGMAVEVTFMDVSDTAALPHFRPVDDQQAQRFVAGRAPLSVHSRVAGRGVAGERADARPHFQVDRRA